MASEMLRKLAAQLREEAAALERDRMTKCAAVLLAAKALVLMKEKISG